MSCSSTLLIVAAAVSLAAAQYFYIPSSQSSSEEPSSDGEYIELVRVPRAVRPSYIPTNPLPPRVGAPGGIPLPAIRYPHRGVNPHSNAGMYDPMVTSASNPRPKDPLVTAESHGHGGHHHGHDYVDYGAYTGGWGAFGWYTDHPVHGH